MQRHLLKLHSRLPNSLNSLRFFEASARYLSFTHTAIELNVTQSAVSRQIRQLEDNLGFKLFIRLHRQLQLTNEGRELAMLLGRQFGELNRAIHQLTPSLQNELNIRVETSMAVCWLAPRLYKFRQLHPNLRVNLTTAPFQDGVTVNLKSGGYDIAIFGEKYPDVSYINNVIRQEYMAPIYHHSFNTKETQLSIEQTLALTHIHPTLDRSDWQQWLYKTNQQDFSDNKGIVFNSMDLSISSCMAGEGVAIMDLMLVLEQLQESSLCSPNDVTITHSSWKYYYYISPEVNQTSDITAFIDWLKTEVATDLSILSKLANLHHWKMP